MKPTDRLPRMERFEFPSDIFVDVANAVEGTENRFLITKLREACVTLLEAESTSRDFVDPAALGELIFLAARLEAKTAIKPLEKLVRHPHSIARVRPQESVRARAIRALLGILASDRTLATKDHEVLFQESMYHPDCSENALTALIGLFHQDRAALIAELASQNSQSIKVNST